MDCAMELKAAMEVLLSETAQDISDPDVALARECVRACLDDCIDEVNLNNVYLTHENMKRLQ
jgi:hypothetical protein